MGRYANGFERVYVYLAPDELSYLRAYAKRKRVTMTNVLRQSLLRELRLDIEKGQER